MALKEACITIAAGGDKVTDVYAKLLTTYTQRVSYVYMKTALIHIRTNSDLKNKAQKFADELGLPLSGILHAYLKQLVRTREVRLTTRTEQPTVYLRDALKSSKKELDKDQASPVFTDQESASSWLRNKKVKNAGSV